MYNNRKFNHRYTRLPHTGLTRPLWIDLLILLITAGLCAGIGQAGLALLERLSR